MGISNFVAQWSVPVPGTETGTCAVCAYQGSDLLPVDKVLDSSTGKINELFSRGSNVICKDCSALWQKPKVWHRSIFVTGDRLAFPLIAAEGTIKKAPPSANRKRDPLQDWTDRPTWRELIRDESWWGKERYAVLSTDGQRRVWQKARMSKGENMAIVFHALDRGLSELVAVNLPLVCECLDTIEKIYSNGFSKEAIATSLFGSGELCKALPYEKQLKPLRGSIEFIFALTVAQKDEGLIDVTNPQRSLPTGRLSPLEKAGNAGPTVSKAKSGKVEKAGRESDGSDRQLSLFG